MAQGPLQAARRLAGGLAVQPSIKTLTQRSSTGTFLSIENSRPRQPPPSVREGRGNGGGREGERRGNGQYPEDATLKCIFLTTCLPWFFAQMRIPPLKREGIHPPGDYARLPNRLVLFGFSAFSVDKPSRRTHSSIISSPASLPT